MKTKRYIFDTNILISALIVPSSIGRTCLKKADENGILIFSVETLTELNEVIVRSKFDKYVSIEDRLAYIERLEQRGKVVKTTSNFTDCRDSKDNKFLNLAFDSNAFCLVTGDQDLLILNPFHGTKIIPPNAFLIEFPV